MGSTLTQLTGLIRTTFPHFEKSCLSSKFLPENSACAAYYSYGLLKTYLKWTQNLNLIKNTPASIWEIYDARFLLVLCREHIEMVIYKIR